VAEGKFRQDLLARLGLLSLRVPPLRERREDLGLLIRAILRAGAVPFDRVSFDSTPSDSCFAMPGLSTCESCGARCWPRLTWRARRTAMRCGSARTICRKPSVSCGRPAFRRPGAGRSGREVKVDLTDAERELRDRVIEHLRRANGNVSDVARQMARAHADPEMDCALRNRRRGLASDQGVKRCSRRRRPEPHTFQPDEVVAGRIG